MTPALLTTTSMCGMRVPLSSSLICDAARRTESRSARSASTNVVCTLGCFAAISAITGSTLLFVRATRIRCAGDPRARDVATYAPSPEALVPVMRNVRPWMRESKVETISSAVVENPNGDMVFAGVVFMCVCVYSR